MAEFKDSVPHTGGVLTIHKQGGGYSLGYSHANAHAATFAQVLTIKGKAVAIIPILGMSDRPPEPEPPQVLAFLQSDAQGMFGRRCPRCESYFRTGTLDTKFCPYCDLEAPWNEFLTSDQKDFIRKQHDTILAAMDGPDGDTTVDFDAQIAELTRKDRKDDQWVYSEEKQQTHFKCSECGMDSDVLGEYVRCPKCGRRTARKVIERMLADLSRDFQADSENIPKAEREQRQRRWRHYIPAIVSEFEALGRDLQGALALLPLTPPRRKQVSELSFQNVLGAAADLQSWFGIEILKGIGEEDRAFLRKLFNRRHLFAHSGGKVDQEYLDRSGDTTVRLNEVVQVSSKEVRRLLALVSSLATNLLNGFESIDWSY